MKRNYTELDQLDREHEKRTKAFLQRSNLTSSERRDISQERGSFCTDTHGPLIGLLSWCRTIKRETQYTPHRIVHTLRRQLKSKQLTPTHLVVYINYPAWSEQELADKFGVGQDYISKMLASVRRAWPDPLRLDPHGYWGIPTTRDMKHIDVAGPDGLWHDRPVGDRDVTKF